MGLDAVEHRQRVVLGRGREAEGNVLQYLDQHAAEAERHQLAERAVGDGTDNDLGAAGQHLLDLDALDLGVGLILLRVCENGLVGLFGIGRSLDANDDAARFGLVENVRRDDFHHHREAHARCDLGGLGGGLGHAFFRNRDAVGVAHHLAFRRGEAGALFSLHRIEHPADSLFGARLGDLAGRICRI